MVLFNYSTKEITAKIVYYGPGLCGKTTNLQFIYENLPSSINKGKMLSLATKTDRTLFFDFLPIDLGTIRGMRTRLQLYTVPGQVFYNTTRKLVLKGADGVVFVADSQRRMLSANLESFSNLEENLAEHDMSLRGLPLVIQFNKRDLPEVATVDELNASLNKFNAPIYEAVATTGIGVHETLRAITRLVLNSLKERYQERKETRPEVAPAVAAKPTAAAGQGSLRPAMPATPSMAAAQRGAPSTARRLEAAASVAREPVAALEEADDAFVLDEVDSLEVPADSAAAPSALIEAEEAVDGADGEGILELATSEEPFLDPVDSSGLDLEEVVEVTGSAPVVQQTPAGRPVASRTASMEGLTSADPLEVEAPAGTEDLLGSESFLLETSESELERASLAAVEEEAPEEEAPEEEPPAAAAIEAGSAVAEEVESESVEEDFVVLEDERHDERLPASPAARHSGPFDQDRGSLDLDASLEEAVQAAPASRAPAARITPEGLQEIVLPIHLAIGGKQIEFNLRITLDPESARLEQSAGGRGAVPEPRR